MHGIFAVGLGGAVGAAGRYLVSLLPLRTAFPVLTLLINFLGAVLIGFLAGISGTGKMGERGLLFWKTGVCGGFTTFSTFSLEALTLLQNGRRAMAGIYIMSSVLLCLLGAVLGEYLAARLTRT